jgi:hypothetical protein
MPGVAITSTLPQVGVTASPTWADQLVAWCNEVEADLEASIVTSEITIDANLEFNSYKAIEMGGARFNSLTAAEASSGAGNSNTLEVVAGDLRFVDGNGVSVQLTSGGSVNISGTGGITGNYETSDADVSYTSSTDTYTFLDESGPPARPAKMDHGSILLRHETAAAPAITVSSPATLTGGAYNFVLPAAVGGGYQMLAANNVGSTLNVVSTNTISTQCNFWSGITVKQSGAGSDRLDHFQQDGTYSVVGALVPPALGTLGWVPTLSHSGVTAQSGTFNYVDRYAFVQKIGVWVTLFARIEFYLTWAGGDAAAVEGPIFVAGVPYPAWSDTLGSGDERVTAYGEVYEFPKSNHGYDFHSATPASTGMVTSESASHAPNDSSLNCYIRASESTIRFYPTSMITDTTDHGAVRKGPQAYRAAGWGPSHDAPAGGGNASLTLVKETDISSVPTSLNKIYTIAFKINYRAL